MNFSPPGSSVQGISQARILEWVAISFSRGPSPPRDQTYVFYIGRRIVYQEPPGFPMGFWRVKGESVWGSEKVSHISSATQQVRGSAGFRTCNMCLWSKGLAPQWGSSLPNSGAFPVGSAQLYSSVPFSAPVLLHTLRFHTLLASMLRASQNNRTRFSIARNCFFFFFCYCYCIQAPAELMSFWNVTWLLGGSREWFSGTHHSSCLRGVGDAGRRGGGCPSFSPAARRLCSAPVAGMGTRCQPGHFSSPGWQFLCCFSLRALAFHF